MARLSPVFRRFVRGATFTEYLIIVGAIAILSIAFFADFGLGSRFHVGKISEEIAGISTQGTGNAGTPIDSGGGAGTAGNGGGSNGSGNAGDDADGDGSTGGGAAGGSGSDSGSNQSGDGAGGDIGWNEDDDGGSDLIGGDGGLGGTQDPGGMGGESCAAPGANAPTYTLAGNPINLATGNKFQEEVDYTGSGEFPLALVRAYNSFATDEQDTLGPGWQHNYAARISLQEDKRLRVTRADGRRYHFRQMGQRWVTVDGNVDQLRAKYEDEELVGWTYTPGTGGQEQYDAAGRLVAITHLHGQTQTLEYNGRGQLKSVTDSFGQRLRFHYQGTQLTRVDTPDGQQLHYGYDEFLGNLVSVSHGRRSLWQRLTGSADAHQRIYHYEDPNHRAFLTGITDESQRRFATWAYDNLGRAILSEHADGVERISVEYLPNKTRVENAAGKVATYHLITHHGIKRLARIEGDGSTYCPDTRYRHVYADTGFLAAAIDEEGRASVMQRNERGLVTEEIQGALWQNDAPVLQPESRRIVTEWHEDQPLPIRRTYYSLTEDQQWQAQREEFNHYDEQNRLSLHTQVNLSEQTVPYANQGESRSWVYQYQYHDKHNTQLQRISITDPRKALTHIDYDAQGRMTDVTNALDHVTHYSQHTAQGRPGVITDPNGLITRLNYNERGWLTQVEREGNHTSQMRIEYLANGLPSNLHMENGDSLQVTYNDARQVIGLTNSLGEQIAIQPNAVSGAWESLSIQDQQGEDVLFKQRQLDELGRVIALMGNAGQHTRVHYDKAGQPVRIEQQTEDQHTNNPSNLNDNEPTGLLTTVQHYDALSRLTQSQDPAEGKTHFAYGADGQLSTVTAANQATTRYTRDGLGKLLQLDSPDTGVQIHYYDRAGQLSRTHISDQPDKDIRYHYDALGRLTRIQYSDPEEDVTYQYDQTDEAHGAGIGRVTRITSRHSQIDYRYDPHGNLLADSRKTMVDGNTYQHRISYSYTTGNQLASITYPNGQTVHYHYQNGRHSQVVLQEQDSKTETPLITGITHRPFGGMDSWTYGNGLTQQLEHDLDGRITAVRVQDEQQNPIWQQAYQYDRLNNITGIERSEGQETYQQQFGYDMLQRLIKDQGPYGQQRFEYDAVGNRLSQHYAQGNTTETKDGSDENLTHYHYAPASNRLLATSQKDIVLDPAGNTLQESNDLQHSYAYNNQNRISEYKKDGRLKARYHYNALGQRIHKVVIEKDGSEQHTLFHYGQQGQLLGETQLNRTNANHQQHAQNIVWLQMRPIVAIDTTENEAARIAWLHSDHLLTARAATDDDQNILWRWHSDAFGVGKAESLAQTGQSELTLNLRFPGQYHDEESGMYYNYFRTYDPSKGRYTQSDPIGLVGGINSYAYGLLNPASHYDLLGLEALCNLQHGQKPTSEEYGLVDEGKLAQMWENRCAAGDPIGCVGFATWGSAEDVLALHGSALGSYWVGIGATVRTNARNGLVGGNPDLLASEAILEQAMLSFGKAIATAHLDATAIDKTNRHYYLSPSEITEYHHQVFDDFNVSRRWYGGSYIIGVHVPPLAPTYCIPACDKEEAHE